MIGCISYRRPFRDLLLRIDHLIRSVPEQEFCLDLCVGTGYDKISAQFFQQGGRLKRALKIAPDRYDAHIEVVDTKRSQERFIRTVSDLCIRDDRKDGVDPILIPVHSHDLMAEVMQLLCNHGSEMVYSYQQYRFHIHAPLPDVYFSDRPMRNL